MLDQLGPRPGDLATVNDLLQTRCGQPQVVDQRHDPARRAHLVPFPAGFSALSAPFSAATGRSAKTLTSSARWPSMAST